MSLARPMPVYITYQTLSPEGGRMVRRPDIYGRDGPVLAAIAARSTARGQASTGR